MITRPLRFEFSCQGKNWAKKGRPLRDKRVNQLQFAQHISQDEILPKLPVRAVAGSRHSYIFAVLPAEWKG